MAATEIEQLIQILSKLPGLGPRSARRAALHLVKKKEVLLSPLSHALQRVEETVKTCSTCGNLDATDPCTICTDGRRDDSVICVVQDVADLWALERSNSFKGRYHVLGGTLSALDGIGPEDLKIDTLVNRAQSSLVTEVILATSATVDGQTTAHYIADCLENCDVSVSGLAHGVPVGGELDYLDDGTLSAALSARRKME
ncbi:gap repair protein [Candidatus Terasakiella magnetica]|uniref:Recombination protein RecR n=1 Tax=Candidatus Terasakiella magnetica TaxID=1867952 RepID=A0A1C3REB3_9PROT|nr:recombination mediator RecR [Candidatus Terasakiella magnetica]SCA55627.1 gap repair protein [Candidatus Terasakiella magnetica]